MTLEQREQAAKLLTEFYHNASFWVNDDGYIYGYWGATMGPVGEGMVVLSDSEALERLHKSMDRSVTAFAAKRERYNTFIGDYMKSKRAAIRAKLQQPFWSALAGELSKGLENGCRSEKDDSSIT